MDRAAFRALVEAWLRAVLAALAEAFPNGMPTEAVRTVEFEEDGVRYGEVTRPTASLAIIIAAASLEELPELTELVKFIREQPALRGDLLVDAGGNEVSEAGQAGWLIRLPFQRFLVLYLTRAASFDWHEDAFEAVFGHLESYLASDTIPVVYLSPLTGFESELDEVELPDAASIVRLTDTLKRQLYEAHSEFGFVKLFDLLEWSHALRVAVERPKHGRADGADVSDLMTRTISAMRLLKPGRVGHDFTWERSDVPTFEIFGGLTTSYGRGRSSGFPRYSLEASDVEEVQSIATDLRTGVEDARFALALRRFDSNYERHAAEDQLIDCWVAFESLFLPDGRAELSYRVALRMTRFLGAEAPERPELFKAIRRSYEARSDVVHGNPPPSDLHLTATQAEDWLRSALRAWMQPGSPHTADELDAQLFQ